MDAYWLGSSALAMALAVQVGGVAFFSVKGYFEPVRELYELLL